MIYSTLLVQREAAARGARSAEHRRLARGELRRGVKVRFTSESTIPKLG